jgi:hypothetical protein
MVLKEFLKTEFKPQTIFDNAMGQKSEKSLGALDLIHSLGAIVSEETYFRALGSIQSDEVIKWIHAKVPHSPTVVEFFNILDSDYRATKYYNGVCQLFGVNSGSW